ncbi:hypothetical protein MHZ92_20065 [Sporosarcina sp. ACRSL]|uniref:ParM/StbA family protein n=1 Tax=Sporosarcina sp. ACRSL TaxID=2918215 RepID=UPI001EF5DC62|nr:hypothetical protein [Sporosarcina sp. ACRSL]MCG7346405.1 hypothetical protein [Sporosarcina sp. ACRSL]
MSVLNLGIDAGNYRAKTAGPYGVDSYRTAICSWFKRNIEEDFGEDDMEFEYNGRKGFAGTLASYEDMFGESGMYGDNKAHDDTVIRVLLAIYRYTQKYCPGFLRFNIIVGQPIATHKPSEKKKLIDMLVGPHKIIVNRKTFHYTIEQVKVVAEGTGAFFASPKSGRIHIIDIGSGTVNLATLTDAKHINQSSGTFNYGVETTGGRDNVDNLARAVIQSTTKLRWREEEPIYVCGGVTEEVIPVLSERYKNVQPIIPQLNSHNGMQIHLPTFANAIGFYELARQLYE